MDRRVVIILSLVVAFTGVVIAVKGRSRPSNVIDLSVAQPSGVQQAGGNRVERKKTPKRHRLTFQSRRKAPWPRTFR